MSRKTAHRDELVVLALFGGGLIGILLAIIAGLFLSSRGAALPNWAENVLVAMATGALLKMGDVLAALVSLATGRQVETLGQQLATSSPSGTVPETAADAALQTADAATNEAESIAAKGEA